MVAEPVLATLNFLQSSYDRATEFLSAQLHKMPTAESLAAVVSSLRPQKLPPSQNPLALDRILSKAHDHRFELAGVFVTGLAAAGLFYAKNRATGAQKSQKKRRAKKLANGARCEVVLVVGLPTEPLTRLLALDFERRGYIVYLTILDDKDAKYVHSNTITDDLHYLDFTSDEFGPKLAKFRAFLAQDVVPIQGAQPHRLRLAAVVFAPQLYFPIGPLESMGTAAMEKVMSRLAVCSCLVGQGLLDCARDHRSKLVALVPTIVSTLGMAYHGPEAMFQACFKNFFGVLAKELRPQGISVTQVRMGNLHVVSNNAPKTRAICDAEVRSWDAEMQQLYGALFLRAQNRSSPGNSLAAHGLRGLHHLLFDLISAKKPPSVVYYGAGARMYEWVSALLPAWVLEAML